MNRIVLVVGVLMMLVCTTGVIYDKIDTRQEEEVRLYLGPVPIGYDLEHFRNTGETTLEANE